MKNKLLALCLISINLVNCQDKYKMKDDKMENLKEIFIKQVKSGAAEEYSSFENYSEKDLNALITIEDSILKNNGFKMIEADQFNEKVKKIFNRIIDNNSQKKYLKIETYEDNICDKNLLFYPFSAEYQNIYISKTNKFITYFYPLPQIIDYLNSYPELSKYEEKLFTIETIEGKIDITRWKDIPDLAKQRKNNIQILIARNMYLFNDSRAYYTWLILHDGNFMRSLVTTFGYYDDKELVKWVVENTKFDKNFEELDKVFWNKKCDGTVKLNTEIYSTLKKIITPNDTYLENLKEYVNYLLYSDTRNDLSIKDRADLLAHLVYFGEQYRYDKNYDDQSFFMQRIELLDLEGVLKKEIERNNFYNLPNYKSLYKKSEGYQDQLVSEYGG